MRCAGDLGPDSCVASSEARGRHPPAGSGERRDPSGIGRLSSRPTDRHPKCVAVHGGVVSLVPCDVE